MKAIETFLTDLNQLDIKLWVEGDRLRCNAPNGTLTPELKAELAARKGDIIQFLQRQPHRRIKRIDRTGTLPLSFAQQRLWFLTQLEEASTIYNESAALKLEGVLDREALAKSWREIVRRHEILRASFTTVNGEPQLAIDADPSVELIVSDFQEFSEAEQLAKIKAFTTSELQGPFDLSQGPLWRVNLIELTPTRHILLLVMHHIICDGWSFGILIRELSILYQAYCTGVASPLADLEIQYVDFASWQQQQLQGAALDQQLSYWQQQLADVPALLELPTDHPRPALQSYSGSSEAFALSHELTEKLKALSQQSGATLFMTILAGFNILLSRYSGQEDIAIGSPIAGRNHKDIESLIGFFVNTVVLRTDLTDNPTFLELLERVRQTCLEGYAHQDIPFEKLVEVLQPERSLSHSPLFQVMFVLQNTPMERLELPGLTLSPVELEKETAKFDMSLMLWETESGLRGTWEYNVDLFQQSTIRRAIGHFQTLLEGVVANPAMPMAELPVMTEAERHQVVVEWNDTKVEYPKGQCIHQLFEAQVAQTPEAIAVVFEEEQLTYEELNVRANQLAHYLEGLGVVPETLVGIYVERSIEMVVGLLGILKAGGAYVPLDPTYPKERLAYMIEDSSVSILLSQETLRANLPAHQAEVICLDADWNQMANESPENLASDVKAHNLAYVIYTSGSTGKPKGVMVEHCQVANFFVGMDESIGDDTSGTWLTLTTISFDISILELFWTLTRGFKIILQEKQKQLASTVLDSDIATKPIEFSLFYFANNDSSSSSKNQYQLLLEGAKFADQNDFLAVWTPERHFHEFGGIYPNPSLTSSAIASITKRIKIRSGSVVLPLHNEIRVAEEWSFVDNLSDGRVGISIASGWHPNDFVLAPENYGERKEIMLQKLETIRKLWRGESISLKDGNGKLIEVKTFPRPIQDKLPIWITAAGNPETFRLAGEIGTNLLTHLLGQSIEEVAEKIAIYRNAWQEFGHPGSGHVTLMLHTFIGDDIDVVREKVRKPLCNYLSSTVGLLTKMVKSMGIDFNTQDISEDDKQALLSHAFERYFETSGLLGTPEKCLKIVNRLKAIGVDELACLIDFGVDFDSVITSLKSIKKIKEASNSNVNIDAQDYSIPTQIKKHNVSHLQCTPSFLKMLTLIPEGINSLQSLQKLMVGGEAFPLSLAKQIRKVMVGEIYNMYGPTEATIWSATYRLADIKTKLSIGKPIANTQIYILDSYLQPVPVGVPGELYIGGAGVVRGYLNRPKLTESKFISNPFGEGCIYKTGDLCRYLLDGNIEFLGRIDNQVKIRGFRIELGEIEAILNHHQDVREAVVIPREDVNGDKQLIAYVVSAHKSLNTVDLGKFLKQKLPDYMIPSALVFLETMPLTPNGKIDRKALPIPDFRKNLEKSWVAPRDPWEQQLAEIWSKILNVSPIGVQDNFFDLGGHSLLVVQLMTKIQRQFGKNVPLATLFQNPTIEVVASFLRSATDSLSWPALVPMQPRGTKKPLFCLPGATGNAMYLYDLARSLGSEQPFYALESLGLDGQSVPYTKVEDMAAYYIHAIQEVQPQGPYLLGGHSFGGQVVVEMAQQLQKQGEEIALLVIFDSPAPLPRPKPRELDWDDAQWLILLAETIEIWQQKKLEMSYDAIQSLLPEEQLSYFKERLQAANLLPSDADLKPVRGLVEVFKANRRAYYIVAEELSQIPIILFRASEVYRDDTKSEEFSAEILQDSTWGWNQLSSIPPQVYTIPGNHMSMLAQPHVQVLAEQLKLCLDELSVDHERDDSPASQQGQTLIK